MNDGTTVVVSKAARKTVIVQSDVKTDVIEVHDPGVAGPPNNLAVGSVTTGNAPAVTISGISPNQTIDFVIPVGGTYVHTQYSSSATWTITHNMGYKPNVTVVDSAGTIIEGAIDYQTGNTIVLTFSAPFAGTAYLS